MHLDLSNLPDDPTLRIVALLQLEDEIKAELEDAYAEAYFESRLTGMLDAAFAIKRHARRHILKLTRQENARRGRQVLWGDSLDPTSTGFQPGRAGSPE